MKMFTDILAGFFDLNEVAGHEWFVEDDGTVLLRSVIVLKTKDGEIKLKDFKSSQDFSSIIKSIDSSIPIILTVNGRGVLHKKTEADKSLDVASKLHKVFPNSSVADFVIQQSPHDIDGFSYISIIRKNALEEIIGYYKNEKKIALSCSLGLFPIVALKSADATLDLSLAGSFSISWVENSIDSWIASNENQFVTISGQEIDSKFLISISSGVNQFNRKVSIVEYPELHRSATEFLDLRKWKKRGVLVLISFFVILLVNALLFSYKQKQFQMLSSELTGINSEIQHFDDLSSKLNAKEHFVYALGITNASHTSFYSDKIAASVPLSIKLNQLWVQPVLKGDFEEGTLQFVPNLISVKGECFESNELNDWIKTMKKLNWVKDVSINLFEFNKDEKRNKFELIIKIS